MDPMYCVVCQSSSATVRAVPPSSLMAAWSAPCSSSKATMSAWPTNAAACSAVEPFW